MRPDERGSVLLPMAFLLSLSLAAGFGFWGVLRHWRFLTTHQLRLDRCTREAALELKSALGSIEASARQIRVLRAAIATAMAAAPETVPPMRTALSALAAKQDVDRGKWLLERGKWLAKRGCGGRYDWAEPLPPMDWTRPASDLIGPHSLEWNGPMPDEFRIRAYNGKFGLLSLRALGSAAQVGRAPAHGWQARWIPVGRPGPGSR